MNHLSTLEQLLDKEDMQKIVGIKDELTKAWRTQQIFRTETEARHAVLNEFKFPTKAAKYWQAVREQMGHFSSLVQASFDSRRLKLRIEEIEYNLKNANLTRFEREELLIQHDELKFSQATNAQLVKDRVREVIQWSKIKKELDDGSFDTEDVNTHQAESLFKSMVNRAKVAPNELSTDERLTIKGILFSLGKDEVNREEFEKIIAPREKE